MEAPLVTLAVNIPHQIYRNIFNIVIRVTDSIIITQISFRYKCRAAFPAA